MLTLKKIRDPKKIEPPDGVGEKLAENKRPCLPAGHKPQPSDFSRRFCRITADVVELRFGATRVVLGLVVEQKPQNDPAEPERTSDDKGPAPSETHGYPWH